MSDQRAKAAEFLRKAAEALDCTSSNTSTCSSTSRTPSRTEDATDVTSNVRALFTPYRGFAASRKRRGKSTQAAVSYWTHRFCCLANSNQTTAPTREEKQMLYEVGLGEKKITFLKESSAEVFRDKLEEVFPQLEGCGGFELLRSNCGSRVALELLRMPSTGFSSLYLANESNLGQAMCYIRPIQKDIDMVQFGKQSDSEIVKEQCMKCKQMVPLGLLRNHTQTCANFDDEEDEKAPEKQRKMDYFCEDMCNSSHSEEQNYNTINPSTSREEVCPVCEKKFPLELLTSHAATCGENSCEVVSPLTSSVPKNDANNINRSLLEKLNDIRQDIEAKTETPWTIKVVRRMFNSTSIEQLEESELGDWNRSIKVHFIGEEGLDSGGLFREFFTILFRGTKVFEGNTFSFDPTLLGKRHYYLLGKAVATAILNGHPGPRCLNRHVAAYILEEKDPDFIQTEDIKREDIRIVIKQIEDATPENITDVFADTVTVLQEMGYSQVLTFSNKSQAVTALKRHFLLYRVMASINQFMEGLRLHNVLQLMQLHIKEAAEYLCEDIHPTADEVASFFKPSFSSDSDQKALEEVIMYNWHKFLKKIEKNKVSSKWIDIDEGKDPEVSINMAHVLQALLGCSRLPMDIDCGLIEFDHSSFHLPKVNTCAPSILFSKTKDLQNFDEFEDIMLYIIIGSYGFGSA